MTGYAIKTQDIEKETVEYKNYDWESFSNLTFEEKVAEYLKITKMLLLRRRSWEFYFNHFPEVLNEENDQKRIKRVGMKIIDLAVLITIFEYVINQMELQIILLE